jgi:hypothetical protein
MKSLGMWMVILALGSFLMHMANMDFILISWMDSWGESTGIVLRVVTAVVGAVLFVVGRKREAAAAPAG